MNLQEQNISQMIKAKVRQKDPLADVILFGSHARGQAQRDSDWDILILVNKLDSKRILEREFRAALFDVELEIGEPISTLVFDKKDWEQKHAVTPLYQSIKREGVYL